MLNTRNKALNEILTRIPLQINTPDKNSDYYGSHVFNLHTMERYVPKDVFENIKKSIDECSSLDINIADSVASAMKVWAMVFLIRARIIPKRTP